MQKYSDLKCIHCGKQVQVIYTGGVGPVELDYDAAVKLHVLRKKSKND